MAKTYRIINGSAHKLVEDEMNNLAGQGWRLEAFSVTQEEPAGSMGAQLRQLVYTAVMVQD